MSRISRETRVPANLAGRRFDQAAAELIPEFSRSLLKTWIESGELTLAGRQAKPKTRVAGGEAIRLDAEPALEVELEPEAIALTLVYEDRELLVIDKPAGLVVHPGAGNRSGTLQNALLAHDPALGIVPRAGIVHRLDKDTTGLLLIARTLPAHQALVAQLERREIRRVYRGVCQGVLTGGGTVEAPIGRHPRNRVRMAVSERGREAVTRYRVVERFRAQTQLELTLETGRTHQIRVHMAHLRHPLVGDPLYGGRPRWPKAPSAGLSEALKDFRRQALHAVRLELEHPLSGRPLELESALPDDMSSLLEALRADAMPPVERSAGAGHD
ncbi:MAG TPA: 23S rRNA pseudouridine(1911/1915/1917) synthase RluD [Gammaproteobacteria bacterium]